MRKDPSLETFYKLFKDEPLVFFDSRVAFEELYPNRTREHLKENINMTARIAAGLWEYKWDDSDINEDDILKAFIDACLKDGTFHKNSFYFKKAVMPTYKSLTPKLRPFYNKIREAHETFLNK